MSRFCNGDYIQFLWEDGSEVLGSDGYCTYDGRFGLYKLVELGRKVLTRRKNIKKSMSGFTIYKKGRAIYSNRWEIV